jgi:hypothetical protein
MFATPIIAAAALAFNSRSMRKIRGQTLRQSGDFRRNAKTVYEKKFEIVPPSVQISPVTNATGQETLSSTADGNRICNRSEAIHAPSAQRP